MGEAADGSAALQPNVVLMDLRMPVMDGLEAIERIRTQWPQIAIIVLTTYDEDDLMLRSLLSGVRGYLLKESGLDTVLQAIESAARGDMLLHPEMMKRILHHAARGGSSSSLLQENNDFHLTAREREVLAGIASGEPHLPPYTVLAYENDRPFQVHGTLKLSADIHPDSTRFQATTRCTWTVNLP